MIVLETQREKHCSWVGNHWFWSQRGGQGWYAANLSFKEFLCITDFVYVFFPLDFRGKTIDSFIDGSKVRYFPSRTRQAYLLQSVASVTSLILLVVGVVVSIYAIRYTISGDIGASNAQLVASISNAIQIQVMNFIYSFIANALSERENHRWYTVLSCFHSFMCDSYPTFSHIYYFLCIQDGHWGWI